MSSHIQHYDRTEIAADDEPRGPGLLGFLLGLATLAAIVGALALIAALLLNAGVR